MDNPKTEKQTKLSKHPETNRHPLQNWKTEATPKTAQDRQAALQHGKIPKFKKRILKQ